jgi:hypothetical protein
MAQASQDDLEVFEVVMGRQDGSIWHGCFQGTRYALEEFDPLTKMIPGEALGLKPVIDLKIVQRNISQQTSPFLETSQQHLRRA